MYNREGITRTTTWIAALVAVAVALILPLGYFTVSYQYLVGSLEADAELTGRIVSEVINSNPEHWQFEQIRLDELLARRMQKHHSENRRILDLRNRTVAESASQLKKPLLTRRFDLMDAGVTVGQLEISRSLFPLLLRSGLAALLGFTCGVMIFVTLRVLPLRAVAEAEKTLLESEKRYRQLVEYAPDAILVYGKELILYANRAAYGFFGAERPEQLIGQPFISLIHPEYQELIGEPFLPDHETGQSGSHLDFRVNRFDGAPIDVTSVAIGIIYNKELAVQVILHDITERKQFQDELADKVEQLEEALGKVKQLEGIIPICMYCKKIRDDKESWQQLESYITRHSEAHFSHGICPECFPKVKSDALNELSSKKTTPT
jgi:PAS domain S-box-containing protein